jgi:hypothetical protein
MRTITENTVYRLDHNGEVSVAYIQNRPEAYQVMVYDTGRVWDIAGYVSHSTRNGLRYEAGDSYFEFSPLTLEVASEIFPNTKRTFKDLAVLEKYARKAIDMEDAYEVNTEPDETISFTVSENEAVLELIKVENETGSLFYWSDDDQWVEVGEDDDAPTIFDQEVIDIERDDIPEAIELWKSQSTQLTKEDILPLAALRQ